MLRKLTITGREGFGRDAEEKLLSVESGERARNLRICRRSVARYRLQASHWEPRMRSKICRVALLADLAAPVYPMTIRRGHRQMRCMNRLRAETFVLIAEF